MSVSKILIDVDEFTRLKTSERRLHQLLKAQELESSRAQEQSASENQIGSGTGNPSSSICRINESGIEQNGDGEMMQDLAQNVQIRENGPSQQKLLPPISVPILDGSKAAKPAIPFCPKCKKQSCNQKCTVKKNTPRNWWFIGNELKNK